MLLVEFFKRTCLIFWAFLLSWASVFCQSNYSTWYFGNGSGLSFESEKPTVLSNGNLYTDEGCSIISDSTGNLLFYTNGITVWGNDHMPIKNGMGLVGGNSSTQSALIIPKPGNKNIFFLFTVAENAGPNGLAYSTIEANSTILGARKQFKNNLHFVSPDLKIAPLQWQITIKNQILLTPVSEKLIAIRHENKKDYWIITHKWDAADYYAFPLTEKGIGKPVISTIGSVHSNLSSTDNDEAIGYIQASNDGSKIASAICYRKENNIEIFDFDTKSGTLSNPIQISSNGFAYGLCFSPNNKFLYASFFTGQDGIIQYDIDNIGKNGTYSPAQNVFPIAQNDNDYTFGAMQLGPDGKIYIARVGKTMDAILKPNKEKGKSKYQKSFIVFKNQSCTFGLPNGLTYSDHR